jgi:lipopolysaccharide transport system ATP-binding protein
MSDIVIAAENLSKSYLVGHQSVQRESYIALRDVLAREAWNFARKGLDFVRGRQIVQGDEVEEFWALRDVGLEVRRGEVLGVIGRNGAGKSTLLKILSRITEPTRGRVTIRGRVASLLEVGTGFHPELTGRENIYLNGAILGMTKLEIRKKFDDIVAFAEVEQFLDTPVKRYSSGMYVRLAFAVAAYLEPEILIIDEVLAVGDAVFQKKCLGRMSDIATQHGRTVLFVSHNLPSIQALCTRVVLMDAGHICLNGEPSVVTSAYLQDLLEGKNSPFSGSSNAKTEFRHSIKTAWLEDANGAHVHAVSIGKPLKLCFQFYCKESISAPGFGCGIEDIHGRRIFTVNNYMLGDPLFTEINSGIVCFYFAETILLPGTYFVTFSIVRREVEWVDKVERALQFSVLERDIYGTGKLPTGDQGLVFQRARITVCPIEKIHHG